MKANNEKITNGIQEQIRHEWREENATRMRKSKMKWENNDSGKIDDGIEEKELKWRENGRREKKDEK